MATKRKTTPVSKKVTAKKATVKAKPAKKVVSNKKTSVAPVIKTDAIPEMVEMKVKNIKAALAKLPAGFIYKVVLVILIGLVLFMAAKKYRGLVLAGIVNKSPIWRSELNQQLTKRYGQQVMDEIIGNQLIKQEADKLGVKISDEELQEELKKLEEKIGGEQALKDALSQYGLSQAELEDQIRLSMLQRKIVEKVSQVEVTDAEIEEYYKDNQAIYKDKKLDDVRGEISENLKEQKLQEEFSRWFAEVKANAQIETYLK